MFGFIKDIIRHIRLVILHLFYRCRPLLPLSGRTVIIAPHPDDEVIGCAGLIQALVERDTPPHVIIMTGGGGSHRGCCNTSEEAIVDARRELTLKSAKILGIPESHIFFLDYPDDGVLFDNPETEKLKELISSLSPNVLFVPYRGDVMPDHIQTADIVKELMKDKKVSIYEYCVWMWYYNVWNLDYKNAYILKMNNTMHKRKLRAIEQYTMPLAPCGKPWSGVLPKPFLRASRWNKELYFKVK